MITSKIGYLAKAGRLAKILLCQQVAVLCCLTARAYPPGPYHVLYGTVRDQYGTPLSSSQASVLLQTPSGLQLSAPIVPAISIPGVNYLLKVPLDSGVTPDLYQANVLVPTAPYRLAVVIGTSTNLSIEMTTNYAAIGQWARATRVDLTLGIDSNGDGIPDAWEYAFLSTLGTNVPLSSLNAASVLTPDGLTLHQQYLMGSAVFDPGNPLTIAFVGFSGGSPVLQFPTVTGRTYTVLASPDLRAWSPVAFNLVGDTPGSPARAFYFATGIATVQVYLPPTPPGGTMQFYRALVQ